MNPEIHPVLFEDEDIPEVPFELRMETQLAARGLNRIAGVDEAGRGCLAGPVVAAAVILPTGVFIEGVRDSKTVTRDERERLADAIRKQATCWSVAACTPQEIDRLNILWASMEAMRRALTALSQCPDYVLLDGNTLIPNAPWPCRPVVRGDARCHSIAAASILAKTHRDALLLALHTHHPQYGWHTNVGYPTPEHYRALQVHGPTNHHRRSFRLS